MIAHEFSKFANVDLVIEPEPRKAGHRPLALTLGEPAGIGPDIAIKAWLLRKEAKLPAFYLLGDRDFLKQRAKTLALNVADRLDVGMVWVNQAEGGGPELPFGGTKRSGVGRELGPLGIDEFVNKKLIHTTPEGE